MAESSGAYQYILEWELEINRKFHDMPYVRVRNDVNDEGPPSDFTFINNYVSTAVKLDGAPLLGCDCSDCSVSKKCCPMLADPTMKIPNYKNNLLHLNPGNAIYECNSLCKCSKDCSNRVVQKGSTVRFEIFRTDYDCGWGLRTLEDIKTGQFVIEYLGEVITKQEVDWREGFINYEDHTYFFDLDFGDSGSQYTVDANQYGNASRFINHSCAPNLEVFAAYINVVDPQLPRLALFAKCDISKGQELTFDYKMNKKRRKTRKRGLNRQQDAGSDGTKRVMCKCGARQCRKYMN